MERTWFYVDTIITARDDNWYTILVYNLLCGKATWGWKRTFTMWLITYCITNYTRSIIESQFLIIPPLPLPRIWYVKWILYIVAKEIV